MPIPIQGEQNICSPRLNFLWWCRNIGSNRDHLPGRVQLQHGGLRGPQHKAKGKGNQCNKLSLDN